MSLFMDLSDPLEAIVTFLPISGMTYLHHQEWVSQGECTSLYGYILGMMYEMSWLTNSY